MANDLALRDFARADLASLEQSLKELQNGTRLEDLAVAEANVRAVEVSVVTEQTMLDELTVTATRDGVLVSLP